MKKLAEIISVGFNPFFMPFFGVLILFKYHGYFSVVYRTDFINSVLLLSFILTLVFPLISVYLLFRSKIITNINLDKKEERITPTIITLCYYFAFYYFLRRINGLDTVILSGIFGGYLALILSLFITKYWKISLHTLGISSLAGLFVGAVQVKYMEHTGVIIFLFILIGLMGTSRLILKKHTPAQVYAGAILGFSVPYLCVVFDVFL